MGSPIPSVCKGGSPYAPYALTYFRRLRRSRCPHRRSRRHGGGIVGGREAGQALHRNTPTARRCINHAYPGPLLPGVPRWLGAPGRRLSHRLTELALWMPFRGAMRISRVPWSVKWPLGMARIIHPRLFFEVEGARGGRPEPATRAPKWQQSRERSSTRAGEERVLQVARQQDRKPGREPRRAAPL